MGKKTKHKAKELERLRQVYDQASTSTSSDKTIEVNQEIGTVVPAEGTIANMYSKKYKMIKKDLGFLVVLLILMLAILFALNYTFAQTGWGDALVSFIAKIF
ncbi:MAG: hypothetical protein U9M89_01800 [Patescibacteria group bacterium]|nr:hypothetical protein [Patescibacteria group bacterium]